MRLAGPEVNDPLTALTDYVKFPKSQRTVRRYDLVDPRQLNVLAKDKVMTTTAIAIRMSTPLMGSRAQPSIAPDVTRAWQATLLGTYLGRSADDQSSAVSAERVATVLRRAS